MDDMNTVVVVRVRKSKVDDHLEVEDIPEDRILEGFSEPQVVRRR